jgi:hypothetical protein
MKSYYRDLHRGVTGRAPYFKMIHLALLDRIKVRSEAGTHLSWSFKVLARGKYRLQGYMVSELKS